MTTPNPPTEQDIAAFAHAIQVDIDRLLGLFGLKTSVIHLPTIVPQNPAEFARSRRDLETRKHRASLGVPAEGEIVALQKILDLLPKDHLRTLRTLVTQWRESALPPPPTPPSSSQP